jgi:hypothetical protein
MSNTVSSSATAKLLLNDSNWHVWKPLMRLTLMERGVWGHVDNSDPRPAPPAGDAPMSTDLRKWNREENKAIAEILNGCEPGLRGKLMADAATVTSAGLWKKLETSFKDPGIGVMLTIRFGILTRFCPDEGSVREHADLMVSENNKLIGSGLEFDDLTLAAQLLLTLPKSMQAIRQTFLTRPREQLTFENVKAALLAVDHTDRLAGLIRGENPVTPTDSSAMYNNGPFTSPRDKPKRPTNGKWCDYHRSATHSNADCRQQQQSSNSNTPSGKANMAQHKSGKLTNGKAKQSSANVSSKDEGGPDDDGYDSMFVTLDSEIEATALTAATNPASSTGEDTTTWMVDSAATLHFCRSNADMVNYTPTSKLFVKVGDGRRLQIAGIGKIRALLQHKNAAPTPVTLHNVHHVPQLAVNLLSVACMDELGLTVVIGGGKCVIRNQHKRIVAEAHRDDTRHYRLTTRPANVAPSAYPTSQDDNSTAPDSTRTAKPDTMQLWHNRLGHPSADSIRLIFGHQLVTGVDCDAISTSIRESIVSGPLECDSCTVGKAHRKPFKPATIKSTQPLQLIHTDLAGPFNKVRAHTGGRYLMVVVDDCSRSVWVKILNTKDSATVLIALQEYKAWAEARQHLHGHRLLAIRCDGGGEFHSNASLKWYVEHGIEVQKTAPHTSQTNGVAERMNRTIMDKVRTILNASGMSAAFWPEAARYAAHTINRLPSRPLGNKTPYEAWTGKKPDVSHLRPFGCVAFRHIPAQDRHKLSDRARKCAMVGYTGNKQAYTLWDPIAQRIVVSRDVDFREHRWWSDKTSAGRGGPIGISTDISDIFDTNDTSRTASNPLSTLPNSDEDDDEDDNGEQADELHHHPDAVEPMDDDNPPLFEPLHNVQQLPHEPHSAPARDHGPGSRIRAGMRDHMSSSGPHDTPSIQLSSRLRSFPWAKNRDRGSAHFTSASDEASKWRDSRQAEVDSLLKTGTYTLVPRPTGINVVGCKWVDKEKLLPDGSTKLKSRLVAQGFTQRPGIDFYETYSPTVRLDSLRGLLALAAHYDWEIHHMDVKSAYLNGKLDETIYMRQPKGFEVPGKDDMVCLLHKGLYGLKQAGRAWHQTIDPALQHIGLTPLASDHCVYLHRHEHGLLALALYVDDLFIFTGSFVLLNDYKKQLRRLFEMEDLGEARLILGMKITRDRHNKKITLSQTDYVTGLLGKLGASELNPTSTPMETGLRLTRSPDDYQASPQDVSQYQSIVGALMYAACATRPDIAYSVSTLSQYSARPNSTHFGALKRVLRYLRGSTNLSLTFTGTNDLAPQLVAYTDSDWASNQDDRRSVTGYVFILCGGPISWASRRQKTVAQSTVEAEYMATAEAVKEAIWWRRFLGELAQTIDSPTSLYSDNAGSISLAHNPEHHARTKHIDVKYHLTREHLQLGTISLQRVPTKGNTADIFTKALPRDAYAQHIVGLGLTPA